MIFIFFILIIFILIQFFCLLITYKFLFPLKNSLEFTYNEQIKNGEIKSSFLEIKKTEFILNSNSKNKIAGFYIKGKANKTIIMCHGIAWSRLGMIKYMDIFLKQGWNIISYDHRGCGNSSEANPSYGYFEKFDLGQVINYSKEIFPKTKNLGLFGESMGAATIMQYSKLNPKIKFLVLVCPYTDLTELIKFQLDKNNVPKLLFPILLFFIDIYFQLIGNFSIKDITPGEDILTHEIPVFLAHGNRDSITPFDYSEKLYSQRKDLSKTHFYIGKDSEHTPYVYTENKKEFDNELIKFLTSIGIK